MLKMGAAQRWIVPTAAQNVCSASFLDVGDALSSGVDPEEALHAEHSENLEEEPCAEVAFLLSLELSVFRHCTWQGRATDIELLRRLQSQLLAQHRLYAH